MRIAWGNYQFDENAAQLVSFSVRPRISQRGQRMELVYTAHVHCELKSTSGQSAITTLINDFIAAFDQNYQDFTLYDNSSVVTPHSFSNSDIRNVSGNRVIQRSWDGVDPVEYALIRTLDVVVQAVMAEPESNLLYFSERLTTIGTGGPVWSADNTQYGPQSTLLYPSSWRHVVQQGHAVYYFGPAVANGPFFPSNFEHLERRRIVRGEPAFRGQGYTHYPISWHYEYSTI